MISWSPPVRLCQSCFSIFKPTERNVKETDGRFHVSLRRSLLILLSSVLKHPVIKLRDLGTAPQFAVFETHDFAASLDLHSSHISVYRCSIIFQSKNNLSSSHWSRNICSLTTNHLPNHKWLFWYTVHPFGLVNFESNNTLCYMLRHFHFQLERL